jgi:hypothetical protein
MTLARSGASVPAGISLTSENASVRLEHGDVAPAIVTKVSSS